MYGVEHHLKPRPDKEYLVPEPEIQPTEIIKQPDAPDTPDLDEAKTIYPFRIINRGEDTIGVDDQEVVFADFSPKVLPVEAEDDEPAPKDLSVPGPVDSSASPPKEKKSASPASKDASPGDGLANPAASGKRSS